MGHAADIVAYTFDADTYCPTCVLAQVKAAHPLDYPIASTLDGTENTESILATVAKSMRIDSQDERSYDSGQFPKVVFSTSACDDEHEYCGTCGVDLCGSETYAWDREQEVRNETISDLGDQLNELRREDTGQCSGPYGCGEVIVINGVRTHAHGCPFFAKIRQLEKQISDLENF